MLTNGLTATAIDGSSVLLTMLGPATPEANKESMFAGFDDRFKLLVDTARGRAVEDYSTLWIVPGLKIDAFPFEIVEGVSLDLLTADELAAAFDFGIFPVSPVIFPVTEDLYSPFRTCFRLKTQLPLAFGDPDPAVADRFRERLGEHGRCLLAALSFSGMASVQVAAQLSYGENWFGARAIQYRSVHTQTGWPSEAGLGTDQLAVLKESWEVLLSVPENRYGDALALTFRRLEYMFDRPRPEDRLLDLMIAAETLYLAELGNEKYRGELSYRLALRAGLWCRRSGGSAAEAKLVYKLMRTAYEGRSVVAHGRALEGQTFKIGDDRVDAGQLIDAVHVSLASALLSALKHLSERPENRWPLNWDDLLFELIE
jgi:hypothetical protein